MCNKKIKCNLLAAVLILTVLPPTVQVGRPVIEHCCFLISQKLVEGSEVGLQFLLEHSRVIEPSNHLGLLDGCTLREDSHHGVDVWQSSSASVHQAALTGTG